MQRREPWSCYKQPDPQQKGGRQPSTSCPSPSRPSNVVAGFINAHERGDGDRMGNSRPLPFPIRETSNLWDRDSPTGDPSSYNIPESRQTPATAPRHRRVSNCAVCAASAAVHPTRSVPRSHFSSLTTLCSASDMTGARCGRNSVQYNRETIFSRCLGGPHRYFID